jgi:hypothetical protein
MKYLFIILASLFLNSACKKSNDCTVVIITNSAPGCGGWGIMVKGTKYPSSDIPSAFQQNGLPVCVKYELYNDTRYCACCGGTWATIISIKNL